MNRDIYIEYDRDSRIIVGMCSAEKFCDALVVSADDINLILWHQRHFGGSLTVDQFYALQDLANKTEEATQ